MNNNIRPFDPNTGLIFNNKEFMPIPGYDKYYASKDGEIYSAKRNRIRVQSFNAKDQTGYKYISIRKSTLLVHRAVALAWIIPPTGVSVKEVIEHPWENQINHIDEDKTHNFVENLEWVSATVNMNYGSRNSKASEGLANNKNAAGHHINTNAPKACSFLYEYDGNNYTLGELAEKLCCSKSAITEAYRKTTGNIVRVKGKNITRILKV